MKHKRKVTVTIKTDKTSQEIASAIRNMADALKTNEFEFMIKQNK